MYCSEVDAMWEKCMIKNGKFCKYHGSEFKVNRDSDGNETSNLWYRREKEYVAFGKYSCYATKWKRENEYRFKKKVKND